METELYTLRETIVDEWKIEIKIKMTNDFKRKFKNNLHNEEK